MKKIDVILALITGEVVGDMLGGFLTDSGVSVSLFQHILIWLVFPLLAVAGLWICYIASKKITFSFQAGKFFLMGAFATVVDLKLFELLAWLFPINLLAKGISFIVGTLLKYTGNKYWTFLKPEKENLHQEIIKFIITDAVGLCINVTSFYYFTKILGPQGTIPAVVWVKISVILAALISAVSNFLGYKFLVFKK